MNLTVMLSIAGLLLTLAGLILSRTITRRVRVTVHRADFVDVSACATTKTVLQLTVAPECYFVNVTNISLNREVEVTHVWFECSPKVYLVRTERPLPKRLKVDETWETWILTKELPASLTDEDAYTLARVRLSSGKVFRSKRNDPVPNIGWVPGGNPPQAPTGTLSAIKPLSKAPNPSLLSASRAIDLLQKQIAERVEDLSHNDPGVYEWETITHRILTEAFGEHHRNANHFISSLTYSGLSEKEYQQRHVEWVLEKKGMLRTFVRELEMFPQPSAPSVPESIASASHCPKVFVSHSTQDHGFVEKFAADLRANGVDAWFSGWEIKPGDSIRQKIDEGLGGCEFFIIVLSKNSISRPWVQTELDAATIGKLNGRVRKIIPIKIEDCGDLPPTLGSLCWEDFSTRPYDAALQRVLDSICDVDVRPALGRPHDATSSVDRPPKHPQEERVEREIRNAISKLDDNERRFIDWLLIAGRANNGQIQTAGFRLVPNSITEKTGPLLIGFESQRPGNGLVEMDRFYFINPTAETPIKNVLYPSQST
jgi:hypothetical protein